MKKIKMLVLVIGFCMAIAFAVGGVMSLAKYNLTFGGNISFVAKGIEATISDANIIGTTLTEEQKASVFKGFSIDSSTSKSDIETALESWNVSNWSFSENDNGYANDTIIEFKITNTNESPTEYIKVDLSATVGTSSNCEIQFETKEMWLGPQSDDYSDEWTFKIIFHVQNAGESASLLNFDIDVNLQRMTPKDLPVVEEQDGIFIPVNEFYKSVGYVDTSANGVNTVSAGYVANGHTDNVIIYPFVTTVDNDVITVYKTTGIANNSFENASFGTCILPSTVTVVGEYAFCNTMALTVVLPEGLQSIQPYAFAGAFMFSLTIPSTISEGQIGQNALTYCYNLMEIINKSPNEIVLNDANKSYGLDSVMNAETLIINNAPNDTKSKIYFDTNFLFFEYEKDKFTLLFYLGKSPEVFIPQNYKGGAITGIHQYAFSGSGITSVEFSKNVAITKIGMEAFARTDLITVKLSDNIQTISDCAFDSCYNLTTISNTQNVKEIGNEAFANCEKLQSIDLSQATTIGERAFSCCYELTSISAPNVTNIKIASFNVCKNLQTAYLPNVTTIAYEAFSQCTKLKTIYIPKVTTIGEYAFTFCESLTIMDFPSTLKTIGSYAFGQCFGLSKVTLPSSLNSLASDTFSSCYKLVEIINKSTKVTISTTSNGLSTTDNPDIRIVNNATDETISKVYTDTNGLMFYEYEVGKYKLVNYDGTEPNVTIPKTYNGVEFTEIRQYAFYKNNVIETVNCEDGLMVTEIPTYMFSGCPNLKSVSMPSVKTIGVGAYAESVNLAYVDLSEVTAIGKEGFSGCVNLKSVNFPKLQTIGSYAFKKCTFSTITLPSTLTSIESRAFYYCYRLVEIINKSASVEITGTSFGLTAADNPDIRIVNNATNETQSKVYTDANGFMFYEYESGKYKLVNYVGTKTDIVIPKTYNSVVYTTVRQYAFYHNGNLTSVQVEDGVENMTIGAYAFCGCVNIKTINLPGVITLEKYSFNNCENLITATILDVVTIGGNAFSYCTEMETVTMNSVETIQANAFGYCTFKSIILPSSLKKMEKNVFYNGSLRYVTFLTDSSYKWQISSSASATSGQDVVGLVFGENVTETQRYDNFYLLKVTYGSKYWIRVPA